MIDVELACYSRFQVLCAERPAWARPRLRNTDSFHFDGRTFWRRWASGREQLLPSWRAPQYGWVHEPACDCDLCLLRSKGARGAA